MYYYYLLVTTITTIGIAVKCYRYVVNMYPYVCTLHIIAVFCVYIE